MRIPSVKIHFEFFFQKSSAPSTLPLSPQTPSRIAPASPQYRKAPLKTFGLGPSSPEERVNQIRAEGKHTRHNIAFSVFHAAVSVADFHSTIASVVRPADRSRYNFEKHCSTPGPTGGLRRTRPSEGCTSPLS